MSGKRGSGRGWGSGSIICFSFFLFFSKECCFRVRVRVSISVNPYPKTAFFPTLTPRFTDTLLLYVNSSSFWNQLNQHFIARTSCPQLDIGFLLSETPHWSGTSPIIYHISENDGESAEDEWALISTSEEVVPRTFILCLHLCLVRPMSNFISRSEILRIMYHEIVKNCFKVHFIYQGENKVLPWIYFFIFFLFHFPTSKLPFLLRGVNFKQNIVDKVPEGLHIPGNLIPATKTEWACFTSRKTPIFTCRSTSRKRWLKINWPQKLREWSGINYWGRRADKFTARA